MIRFACPRCQHTYSVPDLAVGKRTTCTNCGQKLRVPGPAKGEPVLGVLLPEPEAEAEVEPAGTAETAETAENDGVRVASWRDDPPTGADGLGDPGDISDLPPARPKVAMGVVAALIAVLFVGCGFCILFGLMLAPFNNMYQASQYVKPTREVPGEHGAAFRPPRGQPEAPFQGSDPLGLGPALTASVVFMVLMVLLALAVFALWLFALGDCLVNEPPNKGSEKALWAAVIIFLPLIGSLLYIFFRRPQRKREAQGLNP